MKVHGVIPVMMLPLKADESIDEAAFRKQVDFAIDCGAAAVCAPGFATEFYKLTDEERRRVIKVLAEQAAKRVPVFASTGCGSAYATIELSQFAESVGADGLMVVAPKWCALGVREQVNFYEAVCRNVKIPVMLQDADFTGSGLPAALFVELAERCPNLEFAKLETLLPGGKCAEIIQRSAGKIQVFYGLAGVALLDGLAHGAAGVMPGSGFVEAYARLFELHDSGRMNEAKALFYRMQPYLVFALQHLEIAIQIEKRVMVRRGVFPSDRLREPTLHLDQAYQKQMDELVDLIVGLCLEIRTAKAANP
ncbi:MAG TPA: dihydrodipicolinate synthase family protein [Terriglobia bacterium]|nr:dihydrodipicolinate synthase family protein [Terriglobia bacterium]